MKSQSPPRTHVDSPAALRRSAEHKMMSVEKGSDQEGALLAQWKDAIVREIKQQPSHKRDLLKLLDAYKSDPASPFQMAAVDATWEISRSAALVKGLQRTCKAGHKMVINKAVSRLRRQEARNDRPPGEYDAP